MSGGKDLVLAGGVLQTPPMPIEARRETGFLLRLLQDGQRIGMPKSRPMPSIGHGCHELRVQADNTTWRTMYFIDADCHRGARGVCEEDQPDISGGDRRLQATAAQLPRYAKRGVGMNERTRKRLEAVGARVTTVKEFLDLGDADMTLIEMKIALAKKLREYRKAAKLTQEQVAKRVGSSQSRVAKMEAGDPAVTMDLLVGSLLRLGAKPQVVAETLETAIVAANSAAQPAKPRSRRANRSTQTAKAPAPREASGVQDQTPCFP